MQVKEFPVIVTAPGICILRAWEQHIITLWYMLRPGVKLFLSTDPGFTVAGSVLTLRPGQALAVHQFRRNVII